MSTIVDVAREAGVSTATVSHVINKTRRVTAETEARVLEAIRALGYRPNPSARGLKTGLLRQVGVINVSSTDLFFAEVLAGIEQAAHEQGYGVLIGYCESNFQRQMANLDLLQAKGVDGLIINSLIVSDESIHRLAALEFPLVLLQFQSDRLPAADFIHSEDSRAAYDAVAYLAGLGHTRIACIAGFAQPEHTAFLRRDGYERALRERGLPLREEYFVGSDYSLEDGGAKLRALMALPQPPTAVFTHSDLLAIGAIRAARDLGFEVPRDLSVVGFDDIAVAGYTVPRLTTIHQEKVELGRLAFERLAARIADPLAAPQRQVLPAPLVVRESCGPAPKDR